MSGIDDLRPDTISRAQGSVLEVGFGTGRELNWLLDGIDLFRVQPHKDLSYERVA